jgi:putative flippase GtrA
VSGFNRYFIISVSSLIIDLSIFVISYSSGLSIFHAAIIARLISSVYNFLFNKYYVFKSLSSSPLPYEIIAFFFLAFTNALISTAIINALGLLSVFLASSGKLLIDSFLFVLNYLVQKKIIFKS